MKRPLVFAIIFVCVLIVGAGLFGQSGDATASSVFTVDSTSDGVDVNPGDGNCAASSGHCTLRAAIMEANHTSGGGAINVPGSINHYVLTISPIAPDDETTGDLNITADMSIVGEPIILRPVIIDAYSAGDGVIRISSGVTVSISNVTIQNGSIGYDHGTGIFNNGTLMLSNSTISGNSANVTGGGIVNVLGATMTISNCIIRGNNSMNTGGGITNTGALTLSNSTIFSNTASDNGGGIYNYSTGTVTLTGVTLSDNTSHYGNAGGLANIMGTITLVNSTVSGNTALDGGGIANYEGTAILTNSIVMSNTVKVYGGGIDNGGTIDNTATMTLTNITISGNSADNVNGRGGGIANRGGTAILTNVTLNGNTGAHGGGIFQEATVATQTISLKNTIINNSASGANCFVDAISWANIASNGYNLSNDATCAPYLSQTGDLNNTNPKLGPLQNNGGSTQTHAPLFGSPAIDAIPFGTNGCGTTITTDQRGIPRPIHGKCDIGAYESSYVEVLLPLILK